MSGTDREDSGQASLATQVAARAPALALLAELFPVVFGVRLFLLLLRLLLLLFLLLVAATGHLLLLLLLLLSGPGEQGGDRGQSVISHLHLGSARAAGRREWLARPAGVWEWTQSSEVTAASYGSGLGAGQGEVQEVPGRFRRRRFQPCLLCHKVVYL